MAGLGRGRARIVRGFVMSGACLIVPVMAHIAAGGSVPANMGFLLAGALLSTACVALADRRRGPGEIAVLLLLSQPILHVLLVLAGHHGSDASMLSGPLMLAAHLVAALVLTVLLAGAEAVIWSMAALSATVLLSRVRQLFRVSPAPRRVWRRRRQRVAAIDASHAVCLVRSTPWRGPPRPAAI